MPEWEQDFFPFCPSSPKYYSYFEILNFNQNKQTKKTRGGGVITALQMYK